MLRRRVSILSSVCLVVLLVTACSDGSEVELPPRPQGASQPFDLFRSDLITVIQDAQRKLQGSCMDKEGFPQLLEGLEISSGTPFVELTELQFRPRTEQEAREYGLGSPRTATPPNVTATDPAFITAYDECSTSAWEALIDPETMGAYFELGNALANEYRNVVNEVADGYRGDTINCLEGKGYVSQGGAQEGTPEAFGIATGALEGSEAKPGIQEGGVTVTPGSPARNYVPTQEEAELAVALVQCRTEVGLFSAVDQAALEGQQKIVEDHAVEFTELNPRLEAAAQKADEVTIN